MKKVMRKIIMMIIVIITTIFAYNNVYANDENNAKIRTKIEQKDLGENRIKIEVSISDLENIGEGFNAYSAVLLFEEKDLNLIEIKGGEEWNTPIYNEKTLQEGKTKIVATSNKFINNKGILFTAIFEKKIERAEYDIKFTEFEVAAKINGETIKVTEKNQEDIEDNIGIQNDNTSLVENSKQESTINKNVGLIIGVTSISALLLIGILSIGFGLYRKNKGEK